jgi:peptide deformylase
MNIKCVLTIAPEITLAITSHIVTKFTESLADLAVQMCEVMRKNKGIGLAAPQAGYNLRVITLEPDYFELDFVKAFNTLDHDFLCLINPQITVLSETRIAIPSGEGCLSLPGAVYGKVSRYRDIELTAQDLNGSKHIFKLSGNGSIIIQHENDHLNGLLYPFQMDNKMECKKIFEKYIRSKCLNYKSADHFSLIMVNNKNELKLGQSYTYLDLLNYCESIQVKTDIVDKIWSGISCINE